MCSIIFKLTLVAELNFTMASEWEPLNLVTEFSWTHSTRLLYYVSLQTSKSVLSLMLLTLIFHFSRAKTPWKEQWLVSTLRMTVLQCLKRKFHWDAHRLDITTSLSLNLYQTKVSSSTYFSLKKSLLRTSQKKLNLLWFCN